MSDFGKWIYSILILLLATTIIDVNLNRPKAPAASPHQMGTVNLILGGALALVLVSGLVLKEKAKKRRL